jgi:cupin 2 domain-containing protein
MRKIMNFGNIFESIPNEMKDEVIESLIESKVVKIERIISKGHASPKEGWYDQDQDEWVIIVRGSATIKFENTEPLSINEGGYINIPAGTKHKVLWTDPEIETVWLAVHY